MAHKTKHKVKSQPTTADIYYDYNKLRSYNGLINFILTGRGNGKTFGAKLLGIKDWIKNGEEFVYVRRYYSEMEHTHQFFDDIINSPYFNEYEFRVVGTKGYIRLKDTEDEWNIICHFIPLSISQKYKSTAYPKVTKIFFDEFIIDKSNNRYLKNEVEVFLDLYETIARLRTNVKAFFLANNVSLVNPYFSYWKLNINPHKRFQTAQNGLIVVELYEKTAYNEQKKLTPFGRLIDGTSYGNYAIENESLRDNYSFIKPKRTGNLRFNCSFIVEGKEIGVWVDTTNNELNLYVDEVIDPTSKRRYTITDSDHSPNYTQLLLVRKDAQINLVRNLRLQSAVYFKNLEIQTLFEQVWKYI